MNQQILFTMYKLAELPALIKLLSSKYCHLQRLKLARCNLEDHHIATLMSIIEKNSHQITYLDLTENLLTNKVIEHIANNKTIQYLNLSINHITDEAISKLCKTNSTVTNLAIAFNPLGDPAAIAIAATSNIQVVNMSYTGITDDGVIALSNANNIRELYLRHDNIKEASGVALANNRNIIKIALHNCDIPMPLFVTVIHQVADNLAREKRKLCTQLNHGDLSMVDAMPFFPDMSSELLINAAQQSSTLIYSSIIKNHGCSLFTLDLAKIIAKYSLPDKMRLIANKS